MINAILLQTNIEYEKIAKQCVVADDVRIAQSILDLLRAIIRLED